MQLTFLGNYHWQAVITHLEGSHEDTTANCSLPVIYMPEVMTSGQDISVAAPFKEPVVQHQTRFTITSSSNHLLPAFSWDLFWPKYLPSSTELSLCHQMRTNRMTTTFPFWGKTTALRTHAGEGGVHWVSPSSSPFLELCISLTLFLVIELVVSFPCLHWIH